MADVHIALTDDSKRLLQADKFTDQTTAFLETSLSSVKGSSELLTPQA
jgi:hypothetical protein